jgi:hypothetical protein
VQQILFLTPEVSHQLEGSLAYFRAVGAEAEANLRKLGPPGGHQAVAAGNSVGVQPPAVLSGEAGSSAHAGRFPAPPMIRLMAERSKAISFEWRLRGTVEAKRRTWMSPGVDPVDFQCNIPGVNFLSDLFDRLGDSECARSCLMYLCTKHLQSLGIKPEEWMIPKVMCKRGDGSWG